MCGGDIDFSDNKTYGTCGSCGTKSTLPKQCTDNRAALFNRGNTLRMHGRFYEARALFEKLVLQDETDAEAHWCMALSRHGIEYVRDHKTGEQIPVIYQSAVHSTHWGLLNRDADCLAAIKHSDSRTAELYTAEAAKITETQKKINAILKKQENNRYDTIICCDETNEGMRDRGDAKKIYDALTKDGRKVFYAPITLKDKPADEHEPHVYAALNSANVMLAVGSSPERFNEAWMKKDWVRFTYIAKERNERVLLTCYRDMDTGSLPEELVPFQAMDMSKNNFLRDLVNGVKRITANPDSAPQNIKISEEIPVEHFIDDAGARLKNNDYRAAQKIYERMTRDYPGDYRGWWGLVVCATENLTVIKKRRESAYSWFKSAKGTAGGAAGFAEAEARFSEYRKKANQADKFMSQDNLTEIKVDELPEYLAEVEKRLAAKEAEDAARAEQQREEEKQADARIDVDELKSRISQREKAAEKNTRKHAVNGRIRKKARTVRDYAIYAVLVLSLLYLMLSYYVELTKTALDWSALGRLSANAAPVHGSNNDIYRGEIQKNQRDGLGVYIWNNDNYYLGGFSKDRPNGSGIYLTGRGSKYSSIPDCIVYAGGFRNGERHGDGNCYNEFGQLIHSGKFTDNRPNNYRRPKRSERFRQTPNVFSKYKLVAMDNGSGGLYIGETQKGKRNGLGVEVWPNGSAWFSSWHNGEKNGEAIFLNSSGGWEAQQCGGGSCTASRQNKQ
jgi:hypothetical protein